MASPWSAEATDSPLATYTLRGPGPLKGVAELTDERTAACWVAITRNGIAFTSNAHSGNRSSFRVGPNGQVSLLAGVAAVGGTPVDLALTPD